MTAVEADASRATDTELLQLSEKFDRILLTRDRDFGALVFQKKMKPGVVYICITPVTIDSCHEELQRVLLKHNQEELARSFVVVEPGPHRIRKINAF